MALLHLWVLFGTILLFTDAQLNNCKNPVSCDPSIDYFPEKFSIEYANATVKDLKFSNTEVNFVVVGAQKEDTWKYKFVRCGCKAENVSPGTQIISIPPEKLHVGESPTLALLTRDIPDLPDVRYINTKTYVFSQAVRDRVDAGLLKELGTDETTFLTRYDLLRGNDDVDVSIIGTFETDGFVAASTGKPYLVNSEVHEQSPLGRAEWMKILGLLLDDVSGATFGFEKIKKKYEDVKALVSKSQRRPSVVLNFPYSDFTSGETIWAQPSEKQYITQILRDVNVDYRFMNDGKNTTNLLSIDDIVKNFKSARFYVNTGRFPASTSTTLEEFLKEASTDLDKDVSETSKKLDAVRCGNVWSNQKRITSDGLANDYFEAGAIHPEILLTDLAKIFHPEIRIREDFTFSYSYGQAPEKVVGSSCPYTELRGNPPGGKKYVDKEFEVKGLTRFDIEDEIEPEILPALSSTLDLPEGSFDVFFTKPTSGGSSLFTVRSIVPNSDAESFSESDRTLQAVQNALGNRAESIKEVSSEILGEVEGASNSGGLGAAGIVGTVIGSIALLIISCIVLFFLGKRYGRRRGEKYIRDKYWEIYQLKLDDEEQ